MAALSALTTLKEFFGYHPGQTLKEFAEEVKRLSDAEKTELATLAKAEMIRRGTHNAASFAF